MGSVEHSMALKSSMATYSSCIDDLMQELSAQTAVSVPVCITCRMLHGVSCVCHHDPTNDRLEMHYIYRYIHYKDAQRVVQCDRDRDYSSPIYECIVPYINNLPRT